MQHAIPGTHVARLTSMLARPLIIMRQRVGGIVSCAALLGLMAPPDVAAAISPLYLRDGLTLSIAAPSATEPRDDVSADVGTNQRAVLAEFLSDPVEEELYATTGVASVFLVAGRLGMEDCAIVTVEVVRRTPPSERTTVGTGSLLTSILPRRDTVDPIEIRFPLTGVLALPGERLGVAIAVENRCDGLRSPKLLYDALGLASAVRFTDDPPPPTTTTTTTTTTITTTFPPPPTTTTTLPWPAGCLSQPLEGYDAVFCRLDTLAQVIADEDASTLGGTAAYARLRRRLGRARDLLVLAHSGRRARRSLRRASFHIGAFDRVVKRGGRRGVVDPDLGEELGGLVRGVQTEIGFLRAPPAGG